MLNIGDVVKVAIPPKEQQKSGAVLQYQDKVAVVRNVRKHYHGNCDFGRTYELVGCKSVFGIPFVFPEDWLVPMDEGVTA